MIPEIIPIEIDYQIDPYEYRMRGDRPRQFIERDLKKRVADAVVEHVTIEEVDGPDYPPVLRARVFLARDYGNAQREIETRMEIARACLNQERSWNEMARKKLDRREAELKRAEADFRGRLEMAFVEFNGYDECVGRR